MEARLGARPSIDSLEPRVHIRQRRIERLSDARGEIQRGVQDDVRDRETIRHDEITPRDQPVQPFEPRPGDALEARRRIRFAGDAILEQLQPFGETKAVVEVLRDILLDPTLPLARLGPVFRRRTDESRVRVLLLEIILTSSPA